MTGNVRDIGVTYLTFGICIFTAISILSLFEKRAVIAQRVCSRVKTVLELPEGSKRSYMTIIEIMDYGRRVRKLSSLHGRKSTPTPKFLGTAEE